MTKILALAPIIIFFCAAILVPQAHANEEELYTWFMADEQATLDQLMAEGGSSAELDAAIADYNTEQALISEQLSQLTEKQMQSLMQLMQMSTSSGIEPRLDSAQLATIVDKEYNKQQTTLFLKAYTEKAKFLSKADALRAEAEATGNDQLLKVADMMEQRATDMENKFTDLANGHPGRSEEQVSEAELEAAENAARGRANAQGNGRSENANAGQNKTRGNSAGKGQKNK